MSGDYAVDGLTRTLNLGNPVLPLPHRVRESSDLRTVMRSGTRKGCRNVVVSVRAVPDQPARFGFIVSKRVGNAVVRNRVKRRLRASAWEMIRGGFTGHDVVVRGLPPAATADYSALDADMRKGLQRALVSSAP